MDGQTMQLRAPSIQLVRGRITLVCMLIQNGFKYPSEAFTVLRFVLMVQIVIYSIGSMSSFYRWYQVMSYKEFNPFCLLWRSVLTNIDCIVYKEVRCVHNIWEKEAYICVFGNCGLLSGLLFPELRFIIYQLIYSKISSPLKDSTMASGLTDSPIWGKTRNRWEIYPPDYRKSRICQTQICRGCFDRH